MLRDGNHLKTLNYQAECLVTGVLFEDDTFGPELNEEWKRPHDICENPCLFDKGSSRFDVVQVSSPKSMRGINNCINLG